jgi:hypothetical protein
MSTTANKADSGYRAVAARVVRPSEIDNDVFPLPLTPFERFLIYGESVDHPATFYVELHVEGRFHRPALEAALQTAVQRHPLLHAQIHKDGWRESWKAAEGAPCVDWSGAIGSSGSIARRWIDLRNECGLRVWVSNEASRGDVLHLQFHHACCDGLGAGRLIVDLMSAYSTRVGPVSPKIEVRPPDPRLLKDRGRYAYPGRTTGWQKLSNTYRFHLLAPTPLAAPDRQPSPQSSTAPVIATHVFDRDQTSRFSACVAEHNGLTINHIAIALLFRTVNEWQQACGRSSNKQRFRILMPIDLREPGDRDLPATNRVGFSFPTRMSEETQDWQQLLSSLEQEIRFIRSSRLGIDFLGGLNLVDSIPGLLPSLISSSGCMATTLITNFGQSRRYQQVFPATDGSMVFGNVRLHHIVATPPISRSTRAGFGMCITSGRLVLSVQCCPLLFNQQSAGKLLQVYAESWSQWADRHTALPSMHG